MISKLIEDIIKMLSTRKNYNEDLGVIFIDYTLKEYKELLQELEATQLLQKRHEESVKLLKEALQELEATRWISVSEKPKNNSLLDIWDAELNHRVTNFMYCSKVGYVGHPRTTHWRYAPQPPVK